MKVLRWLALRLFQALGWKLVGEIPQDIRKAVLVVAPHTSNWDGFYGLLFCFVKQLPVKFAVKKEAMIFPAGPILKWMGAIPIDRKRKSKAVKRGSMVQHMTAMLQQKDSLMLIIAPEGTRSRVRRWKQGFYHIALQANVPLVLSYLWFTLQATMIRTSSRYRLFIGTKWASIQSRVRSTRRAGAFKLKGAPLCCTLWDIANHF
jgi:1-acyl-sn-glycerol-3-phosphate acyltransferase